MTPICVGCRLAMRCSKTGRDVAFVCAGHDDAQAEVLRGDEYSCSSCGRRVVTFDATTQATYRRPDPEHIEVIR